MAKQQRSGLPSREQILEFIESSDQPAGKREIARAFGLSGNDKIALKQLLRDMGDEGLIDSAPGRAFHKMGGVPKVTVLRVVDVDDGGNAWAVPERWEGEGPEPRLRLQERGRKSSVGVGDRILARTEAKGNGYLAYPMKKLLKGAIVSGCARSRNASGASFPYPIPAGRKSATSCLPKRSAGRRASPRACRKSSAIPSRRAASA
jgi:ribonuclease R